MTGPALLALRVLLALALYGFLFAALWLLWRDLVHHTKSEARFGVPVLTLIRRAEAVEPETFRFETAEVTIGRDLTCHLRLDDKAISARHARLLYHHKQWWIEDLHSTNGTFLNTEGVVEPVVIASGDALRCGGVEFDILIE